MQHHELDLVSEEGANARVIGARGAAVIGADRPRSTRAETARPANFLCAALAALMITTAPLYAEAGEIVHVVARGQTLGRIAKRYHTTVESIREVNNLKIGQPIRPGLVLVIPEKGKEAEAARKAEKLRRGDEAAKGKGEADAGKKKGKGKAAAGGAGGKKGEPEKDEKGFARTPKRPGFVRMSRGSDVFEGQVLTRHGRLVPKSLAGLSKILRFYPTNEKIPIDPRLATLIGMVSDHFGGRTIKVVSGYRPYSPAQYTPHSNHNFGRAMDFAVDGVPNTVVRDFCRTFRNAGVGYYPNSSFVHLDVRAGKMYWVDHSRPGEAPRYDGPAGGANADEAATDVEPHPGVVEGASDPAAGSAPTQPVPSQPSEVKKGNPEAGGEAPGNPGGTGQN